MLLKDIIAENRKKIEIEDSYILYWRRTLSCPHPTQAKFVNFVSYTIMLIFNNRVRELFQFVCVSLVLSLNWL